VPTAPLTLRYNSLCRCAGRRQALPATPPLLGETLEDLPPTSFLFYPCLSVPFFTLSVTGYVLCWFIVTRAYFRIPRVPPPPKPPRFGSPKQAQRTPCRFAVSGCNQRRGVTSYALPAGSGRRLTSTTYRQPYPLFPAAGAAFPHRRPPAFVGRACAGACSIAAVPACVNVREARVTLLDNVAAFLGTAGWTWRGHGECLPVGGQ
jgi:hypothetical protein